jgi:hypothetical protein
MLRLFKVRNPALLAENIHTPGTLVKPEILRRRTCGNGKSCNKTRGFAVLLWCPVPRSGGGQQVPLSPRSRRRVQFRAAQQPPEETRRLAMLHKSCKRLRWVLAGIAVAILAAYVPAAADTASDESYKKSPGYVDFEPIVGNMESKVEVFLKGSLLVLAREAVRDDDPELSDLLSKITYVHVQVFPVDETTASALKEKTRDVAKHLEKKGWEMTIRVREEEEQVLVYLLPGKGGEIQGVVVMVVEDDEDAAFINIVGDINPAEIGKLGRAFHLDSMGFPMKVEVDGDADIIVEHGAKEHHETD